MYIKNVEISNFRNISKMYLDLNKNINIFIGKNAQGKTSILESIYVLGFTKSCRNCSDDDLIKRDELFFKIKGSARIGNISRKMEVFNNKKEKIIKLNNKKINKISDYITNLNLIMFSPDDLDIVKKSPLVRRNFLNIELCQLYKEYLNVLNEYNKILKMRNDYIRKNYSNINYDYLNVITNSMVDRIVIIHKYRNDFINSINEYIDDIFFKISNYKSLFVKYEKSLSYDDKDDIMNFYVKNYSLEIDKGTTLYGPHRDDFTFYFNNEDLKIYGSQGFQRLAVLAFKFSEIELFKKINGNYPIVLLDDIFSEIDLEKRKKLLRFIKGNIQFIITTTDLNNISDRVINRASIFMIDDGMIQKRRDKNE